MKMEVHYAINNMVDMMLKRSSPQDVGFYVCVDAHMTVYGEKKDTRCSRKLHFLIQRPNNYTKVFLFTTEECTRFDEIGPDAWKFMADHDSCWREGISSPLLKAWCEMREVLKPVAEREKKTINEFVTFDIFNKPGLVKIDVKERDSTPIERKFAVTIKERM